MSDSIQFGYPFLWDQILKWAVVLQRPAVQGQLLAITIAVLAAKLISKWLWKIFRRRFTLTNYSYRQGQKRSWTGYGALLLRLIFTPLLSIQGRIPTTGLGHRAAVDRLRPFLGFSPVARLHGRSLRCVPD